MRLPDRVESKIELVGECWRWTGYKTKTGYPRMFVDGKVVGVHRFVWETLVAKIPEGMEIDHLCRNRDCINPEHLEVVTHAENMRRAPHIQEQMAKTQCPHGHPYTDVNTRLYRGRRFCRTCQNIRNRGGEPSAAKEPE